MSAFPSWVGHCKHIEFPAPFQSSKTLLRRSWLNAAFIFLFPSGGTQQSPVFSVAFARDCVSLHKQRCLVQQRLFQRFQSPVCEWKGSSAVFIVVLKPLARNNGNKMLKGAAGKISASVMRLLLLPHQIAPPQKNPPHTTKPLSSPGISE